MTSLGLFLWIMAGIALQAGVFLGISFWRYWQAYRRLRQGSAVAGAVPATGTQREVAGGPGFRNFRVTRRVIEDAAQQVCSFYLEPEDGQPLPPFKPGQFLTFRLEVPKADGGSQQLTRCYSLSDAPHPHHYRITIKRVASPPGSTHPPGRSSNFFHDHVQVGSTLQVRAPSGHFYLEPGNTPVVLIAGGIGITPLLGMLNGSLADQPEAEVRRPPLYPSPIKFFPVQKVIQFFQKVMLLISS